MKQLVMEGPRKSRIVDVPVPEISGAQLLVKVTLTGMCHSEWYPWSTAKKGDVFGHEAVGVVAAVGPGVTKFQPGDRVTGLGGGYWKFRGVTRVYSMDEFDRANEDMESHRDNFIKGAIRCS